MLPGSSNPPLFTSPMLSTPLRELSKIPGDNTDNSDADAGEEERGERRKRSPKKRRLSSQQESLTGLSPSQLMATTSSPERKRFRMTDQSFEDQNRTSNANLSKEPSTGNLLGPQQAASDNRPDSTIINDPGSKLQIVTSDDDPDRTISDPDSRRETPTDSYEAIAPKYGSEKTSSVPTSSKDASKASVKESTTKESTTPASRELKNLKEDCTDHYVKPAAANRRTRRN